MRKTASLLLVSLGICATAFAAPDPTGKIDGGVVVSAAFGADGDTSDTVFVAGSMNYGLNPNWAVGVSFGWMDPDIAGDNGLGSKVDAGSETLLPLFGEIIYRPSTGDSSLSPYFDLGLGVLFANHGGNRDLSVNNLEPRDSDGFAVKLAGGVDWFVTEDLAYTLEIGYVFTDANVDLIQSTTGAKTDTLDLDYFYAGLGVKYRFG